MAESPAVVESNFLLPGFSRFGWNPPAEMLTFEQWAGSIDYVMGVERAAPFALGDLWNYATTQGKDFEDRALQAIPLSKKTILNYAAVCRVFAPQYRRLDIGHLAVVTKIARRDMGAAQALLETAEKEQMSVKELKSHVHPPAIETQATVPIPDSDDVASRMLARDALLNDARWLVYAYAYESYKAAQHQNPAREWLGRYEMLMRNGQEK